MHSRKNPHNRQHFSLNLDNPASSALFNSLASPRTHKLSLAYGIRQTNSINDTFESLSKKVTDTDETYILKTNNTESLPRISLSPQFKGSSLKPTLPKLSNRERVATKSVPDTKERILEFILEFRQAIDTKYQKEQLLLPERNDLRNAIIALDLISKEESPYYDLMQNIVKIIKMGLYFNTELLNRSDRLWEKLDSQLLKKLNIASGALSIPYYTVCSMLLKDINRKSEQFKAEASEYAQKFSEQKAFLEQQHESVIADLQKAHTTSLETIKAEYEARQKTLIAQIETLKQQLEESQALAASERKEKNNLIDQMQDFRQDRQTWLQKIHDLNETIRKKDRMNKEQNERMMMQKAQSQEIRDFFSNIISEIHNIKELVQTLKKEREDLIYERNRFKNLVGMDPDCFTPRPAYKQMIADKKKDFGINIDLLSKGEKLKKTTTAKLVDKLMTKYALAAQQNQFLESQVQGRERSSSIHTPASKLSTFKLGTIKTNTSPKTVGKTPSKGNMFTFNAADVTQSKKLSTLAPSLKPSKSYIEGIDKPKTKLDLKESIVETEQAADSRRSIVLNRLESNVSLAYLNESENAHEVEHSDGKSQHGQNINDRSLDENSIAGEMERPKIDVTEFTTAADEEEIHALGNKVLVATEHVMIQIENAKAMIDLFIQNMA